MSSFNDDDSGPERRSPRLSSSGGGPLKLKFKLPNKNDDESQSQIPNNQQIQPAQRLTIKIKLGSQQTQPGSIPSPTHQSNSTSSTPQRPTSNNDAMSPRDAVTKTPPHTTPSKMKKSTALRSGSSVEVKEEIKPRNYERSKSGKISRNRSGGSTIVEPTSPLTEPTTEDETEPPEDYSPHIKEEETKPVKKGRDNRSRPKRTAIRKGRNNGKLKSMPPPPPETDEYDDPANFNPANFWLKMSEYFAPLLPSDLEFCKIDKDVPGLDASSRLLEIPPKGGKGKDGDDDEDNGIDSNDVLGERGEGNTVEENKIRCEDITARLISALVQDQNVPNLSSIWAPVVSLQEEMSNHTAENEEEKPPAETNSNSIATSVATCFGLSLGNPLPNSTNPFPTVTANNSPAQTPTIPPTFEAQSQFMSELNERIKKELSALGLFDPATFIVSSSNQSENDELCRELKKLQNELKQQVIINKQRRSQYYNLVLKKMEEQQKQIKYREKLFKAEENLLKQLKSRSRKRTLSSSSQGGPPSKQSKNASK